MCYHVGGSRDMEMRTSDKVKQIHQVLFWKQIKMH